ncbi:MAG: molecular chaperone TorD family protein [Mucispirillum sp.]|nr:molecular chaperone TorD family protein [Mucispirillum sp.]
MQLNDEIISIMQGREVTYAAMSDLFLSLMEVKQIKMLEDLMPIYEEMAENTDNQHIKYGVSCLSEVVREYKASNDTAKKNLLECCSREYSRLFCLGNAAAISESVYVSPLHLTMQEQELEVRSLYKMCSFDMKHTSNEPHDHLSYELMFMSYLSKGTYQNIEKGDNAQAESLINLQKSFIKDHLLNWLGYFSSSIKKYKEGDRLYYPLSCLLLGFIEEDSAFLETL